MVNIESIKYLLEGTAQTFEDLSELNDRDFKYTGDDFFKGKANAYDLAKRHVESLLEIYFNDNNTAE